METSLAGGVYVHLPSHATKLAAVLVQSRCFSSDVHLIPWRYSAGSMKVDCVPCAALGKRDSLLVCFSIIWAIFPNDHCSRMMLYSIQCIPPR